GILRDGWPADDAPKLAGDGVGLWLYQVRGLSEEAADSAARLGDDDGVKRGHPGGEQAALAPNHLLDELVAEPLDVEVRKHHGQHVSAVPPLVHAPDPRPQARSDLARADRLRPTVVLNR